MSRAEVVICGAGMAGVAAAYHLAVRRGVRGVALVDPRQPLSLTSSRGTEAYRTWWPGPDDAMIRLTGRSVDLLEELSAESGGAFAINRRGYAFLTADAGRTEALADAAERVAWLGGGPLRRHPHPASGGEPYLPSPTEGLAGVPDGADLIADPAAVRRLLPAVNADAAALLHVRRAGWLDSGALGHWLLERALEAGVELVRDRVAAVDAPGGRVRSVRLAGGGTIDAGALVLAPGPGLAAAGRLLGLELPAVNEAHGKLALDDVLGAVPRDAPLLIWHDPIALDWSEEERRRLAGDPATRPLLDPLPSGLHCRPRGEREVLVLWSLGGGLAEPPDGVRDETAWSRFPRFHPFFAEVLLRGLARLLPAAGAYRGRGAEAGRVDGGWYCKAPDNRPLIGPLPVEGAWVLGALSGFGIMSSQGAADLLADLVTGAAPPPWAAAFHPARFDDPDYRRRLAEWDPTAAEL